MNTKKLIGGGLLAGIAYYWWKHHASGTTLMPGAPAKPPLKLLAMSPAAIQAAAATAAAKLAKLAPITGAGMIAGLGATSGGDGSVIACGEGWCASSCKCQLDADHNPYCACGNGYSQVVGVMGAPGAGAAQVVRRYTPSKKYRTMGSLG